MIFDQINRYKSKNYTIIMISLAHIGKFSQLCDLTIYASNGIMKVGQVESGVPMLYTLEKLTASKQTTNNAVYTIVRQPP